jgi:hypothetical protein
MYEGWPQHCYDSSPHRAFATEWQLAQPKSRGDTVNNESRCDGPMKGTNMRSILARLVMWAAEKLDRSLLPVPEVDEI